MPSLESLVSCLLLPASRSQRALHVEGRLDDVFIEGIRRVQSLARSWWGFAPVELVDDRGALPAAGGSVPMGPQDETSGARPAGLCFTGGVDSFYSLLAGSLEPRSLIFVRGFDIRLGQGRPLLDAVERDVRAVCRQRGLEPLIVETNLREHPLMKSVGWEIAHGGALAGVGHLLADRIGTLGISASYPAAWPDARWGSHGLLDPLWSSSRLQARHVGDEIFREEKLQRIARDPLVRDHLRVCWEVPRPEGNCGLCEKCLRTRLILARHHPGLVVRTLPPPATLVEDLERLAWIRPDLCRIYARLAEPPLSSSLARAVRDLVRRSQPPSDGIPA